MVLLIDELLSSRRPSLTEELASCSQPSPRPRLTAAYLLRTHKGKPRLSPRQRREAETQLRIADMQDWLKGHSRVAVPRSEISQARKAELKGIFIFLDSDSSGAIDISELSLAMRVMGFSPEKIRDAMIEGDRDGSGDLDFDEFCAIISNHSGDDVHVDAHKMLQPVAAAPGTCLD